MEERGAVVRCVAGRRPAPPAAGAGVEPPGYAGTLYVCDPPWAEFIERLATMRTFP
jgi:hypothetical protein